MKYIIFSLLIISFFFCSSAQAQLDDDAGAYLAMVGSAQQEMNAKYMAYMSAAAHGRRARKVEKIRQQVLESIQDSKMKTADLPYYKGDKTLRQSSLDYIQLCYHVFNEDYAKIVNIEDIAEQSFDEMQAYILLQEKTEEKIHEAAEKMQSAQSEFATKYNVKLIADKSELGNKMEMASKLNHYQNNLFLLFFKCNWEDAQLTKALNNHKLSDAEQARNALISYAADGLKAIDTLRSFDGDASLAMSCKQALAFYKKTGETDLPKITDFYLKEDNFSKIKKSFEAKPDANRTKVDVDAYNKAVNDMNAAVNAYNAVNDKINNGRTNVINNWTEAEKNFQDLHMPHYK